MMVRMQQSQLPIEKKEEDSESTKHVNVVKSSFYKFLDFLEILYNGVWLELDLLLDVFKILEIIEVFSK